MISLFAAVGAALPTLLPTSRAAVLRGCCVIAAGAAGSDVGGHLGLRPAWAATQSELNSRLDDKAAMKIFKAGQELAAQGADPESQMRDLERLRKAEDRFTLLIDELAPNFAGGYANRANVRVAIGGDESLRGALDDYTRALELAPDSKDAWVNRLNRGSTLVGLGRAEEVRAAPQHHSHE
jgi:tetratricopeptide (TPR) repeat protein